MLKKRKKKKSLAEEPDRVFDSVVIKMMAALAFSVALLFGGVTFFVYAAARSITVPGYESIIGSFLGVHLSILMVYYALALFKYIVSD